jgi:hypothetical protein
MHRLKTGALIRASVMMAAACARDLPGAAREALDGYAQDVGLAFQIQDDILDVEGTTQNLGKTVAGGISPPAWATVELTIALHYVFNTPHDRLVWDVGHQAYPHKVLTGRRDRLHTIKQHRAWRRSRPAPRANTTPSASATRAPRSAPRSAWRSPPRPRRGARRGGHRRWRDDRRHGVRGAESRRQPAVPICWWCSTTTTCRFPRTSARCRITWRACCRGAVCAPARGRQESAAPDAHGVGTRAPLRGAFQGHGAAGHAVRGDGIQLHRADRRPRSQSAGADAAKCAT